MSLRSSSEQLADLRDDARLLIERTGDQQVQLEALVASAEWDVTQAEAALLEATTWTRSDTCSPHNSIEARPVLRPPGGFV